MITDIVSAKIIVRTKDGKTAEYDINNINKMTGYKLDEKTNFFILGHEELDFTNNNYNYIFAIDSDDSDENKINE